MEVLLKMFQIEREENEEKDLLKKMKTFQISSMEEDISIEWYLCLHSFVSLNLSHS